MNQNHRATRWRRWVTAGCIAGAILAAGLQRGVAAQAVHPAASAGMEMYSADPLSGCDDYHCRRCPSRDYCSTGGSCRHPDCGHEHAVVDCLGSSIFYLRAAAGRSSCLSRGRQIATIVNGLPDVERPEEWGYVVREASDGPEVWIENRNSFEGTRVVRVTAADAAGYRYRASVIPMSYPPEAVNQLLVARWWAAILQDHFDAMVLGRAPSRTVRTHCGKPLLKAYEAARKSVPQGKISMVTWREVLAKGLSPTDRDRLALMAQIVPRTFQAE